MGLRVKRYGPLSTMVVVGRLVGTFEPVPVIVTMAQANSASARTNTIAPSQPAGRSAGRNGKATSQLSASPAMTASPHAIGGRITTLAVSAVSSMARPAVRGRRSGRLSSMAPNTGGDRRTAATMRQSNDLLERIPPARQRLAYYRARGHTGSSFAERHRRL